MSQSITGKAGLLDRIWLGAWGVSCIIHLSLITAMGGVWTLVYPEDAAQFLNTRLDDGLLSPELLHELTQVEPAPQSMLLADENAGGGSRPQKTLLQNTQPSRAPLAVNPTMVAMATPSELGDEWLAGSFSEEVGELQPAPGDGTDNGLGNGLGNGEGPGKGPGRGFFGARLDGKRFVFVIDGSGSMNRPHESAGKTRFGRLKMELVNTIARMSPEQEFFIIFFNIEAIPMPASVPQVATPVNQQTYLRWMAQVPAGGDTDPRNAMLLALRMQPDVIFFLTDGEFLFPVRRDLTKLKQDRIKIHTYAFGDKASEMLLKNIAENNGGSYFFVP